jgi:hypothetical protein
MKQLLSARLLPLGLALGTTLLLVAAAQAAARLARAAAQPPGHSSR